MGIFDLLKFLCVRACVCVSKLNVRSYSHNSCKKAHQQVFLSLNKYFILENEKVIKCSENKPDCISARAQFTIK